MRVDVESPDSDQITIVVTAKNRCSEFYVGAVFVGVQVVHHVAGFHLKIVIRFPDYPRGSASDPLGVA